MKKLLIATHNKNKIKEIKNILNLEDVELLTLSDINIDFDVEETGETFEENARKKAVEYFELSKLPVLAEDSGLSINSLGGYPGVYSKRIYEGKSEEYGNKLILEKLKGIEDRTASYVAHYCYYDGVNEIHTTGITTGSIQFAIEGENGFSYDKIFKSDDLNKLFSMATDEEKNSVSHRYRGLKQLKDKLVNI